MPPRLALPPLTRALLLVLLAQSALSFLVRFRQWTGPADNLVLPYLTLVPAMSLPYPWTLATSALVERNVLALGVSGLTLWHGGRYLERAWGGREFAKFVALVAVLSNVFAFATLTLLFAITGNEMWTLTPISGTTALQSAFLTALAQLLPTHTATLFRGLLSLRLPRLPLLHLALTLLLALTPLYTAAHPLLSLAGFGVSWSYLRFRKPALPADVDLELNNPSAAAPRLRGDASDAFALPAFFPAPARPAVAAVAEAVWGALVAIRVCAPGGDNGAPNAAGAGTAEQPQAPRGSARAETERRRALALKALDLRLQAATAARGEAAQPPQPQEAVEGGVVAQPQVDRGGMETPKGEETKEERA